MKLSPSATTQKKHKKTSHQEDFDPQHHRTEEEAGPAGNLAVPGPAPQLPLAVDLHDCLLVAPFGIHHPSAHIGLGPHLTRFHRPEHFRRGVRGAPRRDDDREEDRVDEDRALERESRLAHRVWEVEELDRRLTEVCDLCLDSRPHVGVQAVEVDATLVAHVVELTRTEQNHSQHRRPRHPSQDAKLSTAQQHTISARQHDSSVGVQSAPR
eukprot:433881-Rhodomonas_salina.3